MFYDVFDTVSATIACNGEPQYMWGEWEDGDSRDCTSGCRMRKKITIPEEKYGKEEVLSTTRRFYFYQQLIKKFKSLYQNCS